jgi:hypothetical protein
MDLNLSLTKDYIGTMLFWFWPAFWWIMAASFCFIGVCKCRDIALILKFEYIGCSSFKII